MEPNTVYIPQQDAFETFAQHGTVKLACSLCGQQFWSNDGGRNHKPYCKKLQKDSG